MSDGSGTLRRSAAEQALKPDPNQSFRECAPKQQDRDYCPDMVVVPAGSFMMGSPTRTPTRRQAAIFQVAARAPPVTTPPL
jgi:formylglycine-generating enzyme required for sulfatase activity